MLNPCDARRIPPNAGTRRQPSVRRKGRAGPPPSHSRYVIELGFLAVILIRAFRLPNKSEGERTLLYLTCAALASVSFLRSTVIATNDYGVRASLLAQFFLLLLAARVWDTGHRSLLIPSSPSSASPVPSIRSATFAPTSSGSSSAATR